MRTGRCKHFESRWSVASLGVLCSYPVVAQTEFNWRQPTHSFEQKCPESQCDLTTEDSGGC